VTGPTYGGHEERLLLLFLTGEDAAGRWGGAEGD
jgi:hypothetical protein